MGLHGLIASSTCARHIGLAKGFFTVRDQEYAKARGAGFLGELENKEII